MLSAKSQKFKPNEAKGKGKGKPQKKQVEDEADYSDDDLDAEMDEDDAEFDDEDDDMFMDLFWKMELKPDKESVLEQPENIDGIVCITNACFGQTVNKNSRTVICCKSTLSEDVTPICVLNQGIHESERLNLKFGSSATFTLQGTAPSIVYLTGFVQPDSLGDELPEDLDMEDDVDFEDRFANKFAPEPATKKRKLEEQKKPVETKKQPPKKEIEVKTPAPKKANDAKTATQKRN